MSVPVGFASLSLPDRRILITPNASEGWHKTIVSDSTNADSGGPRSSMLRPGNVLLKDDTTGQYFDDATSGDISARASVSASETADADWQSKTITLTIDGVDIVTVTLGAGDDTDAEVVTALNANATFAAHAEADVNAVRVRVRLKEPGDDHELKISSDLATAFGASGTTGRGTDGDWAVCVEYVDQLDPAGSAADAKAHVVGCGHFDESNLIWGGSATLHQDFKRVMLKRGARFES